MGDETPVPMKQHTQRVGNLLGCEDSDQSCEQWAANGECENNRTFMVGTSDSPGACVKACDACLEVYSAAEKPHGTE
jgi:prolyl 4-hydroxylase